MLLFLSAGRHREWQLHAALGAEHGNPRVRVAAGGRPCPHEATGTGERRAAPGEYDPDLQLHDAAVTRAGSAATRAESAAAAIRSSSADVGDGILSNRLQRYGDLDKAAGGVAGLRLQRLFAVGDRLLSCRADRNGDLEADIRAIEGLRL